MIPPGSCKPAVYPLRDEAGEGSGLEGCWVRELLWIRGRVGEGEHTTHPSI
jgi:hypothetical protein